MDDVAAISTSLGKNPFDVPSTFTRNFSPFRSKFPPKEVISDTIVLKSFFTCLAIATFSIPKSRLIADEEKTTDEAVLAYVKANIGAIGYVSSNTTVNGVKVIQVK